MQWKPRHQWLTGWAAEILRRWDVTQIYTRVNFGYPLSYSPRFRILLLSTRRRRGTRLRPWHQNGTGASARPTHRHCWHQTHLHSGPSSRPVPGVQLTRSSPKANSKYHLHSNRVGEASSIGPANVMTHSTWDEGNENAVRYTLRTGFLFPSDILRAFKTFALIEWLKWHLHRTLINLFNYD